MNSADSFFQPSSETKEGLEALMSIRYYARMRFLHQLLPLHPKHVLSVGAGTKEKPMIMSDLPLLDPKNYSVMNNAANSTTMTSLSLEHLAKEYPKTAFVHAYPGIVKTPALFGRDFGWIMRFLLTWILVPLSTPFCTDVGEAGQLGLFYLTSKRYASLEGPDGVELVPGIKKAEGEGAYLVNETGETGAGPIMKEYRKEGMGSKIWDHTLEMFEKVGRKTL